MSGGAVSTGLISPGAPAAAGPIFAPEPFSSPAPAASPSRRAVSGDQAVGASYEITRDRHGGIHGQLVIANHGSAPVSGWRVTVLLPGDTDYQVRDAGNRSAGDTLVVAAPADGQTLAGGATTVIAFTARGATSTPVRFTVSDPARQQARRDGSGRGGPGAAGRDSGHASGGQPGSGRRGGDGWLGGWFSRGWAGGGWPSGGWTGGGWTGGGWPSGGGHGGGWTGGR